MEQNEHTVTFIFEDGGEARLRAHSGESLLDAARRAGVDIDAPCSGNASCGKCRVRLLSGEVASEANRHINADEYAAGVRLACAGVICADVAVLVLDVASAYRRGMKIADLRGGREAAAFGDFRRRLSELGFTGDSGVELVSVRLAPPDQGNPEADRERLLSGLAAAGETRVDISLHALRALPNVLRESEFSVRCVLRRGCGAGAGGDARGCSLLLDVLPGGDGDDGDGGGEPTLAGLAIDIGTTTVSAVIADLRTGALLAEGSASNSQIRYGADVISRIIESARPGGLERLRSALTDECIKPLTLMLCESCGLQPERIYRVAVAANTVMTHLFAGVSAEHLRLEPYVPAFFNLGRVGSADIGLGLHPCAEVVTAPCVGSYVGGDITAGVFSSMIYRREELSLFLDLGTNGELVLGNSDFLMTCACSAGPAFEGGDISCGMRATDGAVEACSVDEAGMEPVCSVIGPPGARVAGVCGSGLIDLIGELFRCGAVNAKGKFVREGRRVKRDAYGVASYAVALRDESESGREVSVNEIDIDNFIRAKGAVFSAIRTMLAVVGADADGIASVYIAGGIGGGINAERAVRVGLLPDLPAERFHYIGNTSLSGAYAMLTSRGAEGEISRVAGGMTYLELSSHPGYMDEFVAACFIPHTDAGLFPSSRQSRESRSAQCAAGAATGGSVTDG
jgi:uncharacterized 2Fe-2S/4Fe-4S cluster protein (DUF4445 family)